MKFYNANRGMYGQREEWTDNGNGNYVKVYFRIDTIGFDCMNGSFSEEADAQLFHEEASNIISSFGIVESSGFKQDNEYLYAHPQNISGIVAKNKIRDIAEAIDNSKSMTIRWIDVYEEYTDMTDEEYRKILDSKRNDIAAYIVENCFTKRTNQYHYMREVAIRAQERFKTNRINAIEDINRPRYTYRYMVEVINSLVDNGYLIRFDDDDEAYIRSLNKTEQKKNKVNYDMIREWAI